MQLPTSYIDYRLFKVYTVSRWSDPNKVSVFTFLFMSMCTLFIRSKFRSELSTKDHCFHIYCSVVEQTHNHLATCSSWQQNSWPLWTAYLDSLSEILLLLCYIEDTAFDLSLMKSFEVSVKGCEGRGLPETTLVVLPPWIFGFKF